MHSTVIFLIFFPVGGWKQINHIFSSFCVVIHHVDLGFFLSSFVTFTVSCIVVRTITFFETDFFLSMYDINIMLFLPFYIKTIDFSSRLFISFISFAVSFLSWCMVPTIVTFFLVSPRLRILTWNINPSKYYFPRCYSTLKFHWQDILYIHPFL